jgi:hypothetical protein
MSLHGLLAVIPGVPNVHETAANYAGFSEYYGDMDCIIDGQLWTPGELEGARGLFARGRRPLLPASRGPRGHDDRSPLGPLQCSLNWALLVRRDEEDRAVRVPGDLVAHRAH